MTNQWFYTLTGDIQNEESGFLRGTNPGYNAGMKFGFTDNLQLSFLIIAVTTLFLIFFILDIIIIFILIIKCLTKKY